MGSDDEDIEFLRLAALQSRKLAAEKAASRQTSQVADDNEIYGDLSNSANPIERSNSLDRLLDELESDIALESTFLNPKIATNSKVTEPTTSDNATDITESTLTLSNEDKQACDSTSPKKDAAKKKKKKQDLTNVVMPKPVVIKSEPTDDDLLNDNILNEELDYELATGELADEINAVLEAPQILATPAFLKIKSPARINATVDDEPDKEISDDSKRDSSKSPTTQRKQSPTTRKISPRREYPEKRRSSRGRTPIPGVSDSHLNRSRSRSPIYDTVMPIPMAPLSPRSAAFVLQNYETLARRKKSPRRSWSRSRSTSRSPRARHYSRSLSPRTRSPLRNRSPFSRTYRKSWSRSVSRARSRSVRSYSRSLTPYTYKNRRSSLSPKRFNSQDRPVRRASLERRSPQRRILQERPLLNRALPLRRSPVPLTNRRFSPSRRPERRLSPLKDAAVDQRVQERRVLEPLSKRSDQKSPELGYRRITRPKVDNINGNDNNRKRISAKLNDQNGESKAPRRRSISRTRKRISPTSEIEPKKDVANKISDPILEARRRKFERNVPISTAGVIKLKTNTDGSENIPDKVEKVRAFEQNENQQEKVVDTSDIERQIDELLESDGEFLKKSEDIWSSDESQDETEARFKHKTSDATKVRIIPFAKLLDNSKSDTRPQRKTIDKHKHSRVSKQRAISTNLTATPVESNLTTKRKHKSKSKLDGADKPSKKHKTSKKRKHEDVQVVNDVEIISSDADEVKKVSHPKQRITFLDSSNSQRVSSTSRIAPRQIVEVVDDGEPSARVVSALFDQDEKGDDLRAELSRRRAQRRVVGHEKTEKTHSSAAARLLHSAFQRIPKKSVKISSPIKLEAESTNKVPIQLRLGGHRKRAGNISSSLAHVSDTAVNSTRDLNLIDYDDAFTDSLADATVEKDVEDGFYETIGKSKRQRVVFGKSEQV